MEDTVLYSPFRGFWSYDHGWTRQIHLAETIPASRPLVVGFRPEVAVYRVPLKGHAYVHGPSPDKYLRGQLSNKQWERYNRLYARSAVAPTAEQIERAVMQTGDWFALQCDKKKGFHLLTRSPKDCLQKGRGR